MAKICLTNVILGALSLVFVAYFANTMMMSTQKEGFSDNSGMAAAIIIPLLIALVVMAATVYSFM